MIPGTLKVVPLMFAPSKVELLTRWSVGPAPADPVTDSQSLLPSSGPTEKFLLQSVRFWVFIFPQGEIGFAAGTKTTNTKQRDHERPGGTQERGRK